MPEGLFPEPGLVRHTKELLARQSADRPLYESKIRNEIAPLFPETEFIGKGAECIVVGHPENSEKVVAYKYDRLMGHPLQALETYHFHRFFNALYPHNFPRFYASFGGRVFHTVRERIHSGMERKIKYPFSDVIKSCKAIGVPLCIDDSAGNFIIGTDGGQYFVDTIMNLNSSIFWKKFDPGKLEQYMKKNDITGERTKDALASLRRLKELEVVFAGQCYLEEPDEIPQQWQTNHLDFWRELCEMGGFGTSDPQDVLSRNRIIKTIKLFETYARDKSSEGQAIFLYLL